MPSSEANKEPDGGANDSYAPTEGESTYYKGEESCRIASAMARLGATVDEVSQALGIAVSSFHEWRHTHREFAEAFEGTR